MLALPVLGGRNETNPRRRRPFDNRLCDYDYPYYYDRSYYYDHRPSYDYDRPL